MAKQVLPVNFTDDLLAESMDGKRKYQMIDNGDGTISLEDVSEYLQMGSVFGAGQINSTNQAVNESVDKDKILKTLEEVSASTDSDAVVGRGAVAELNQNMGGLTFAQDSEGKWGYKPSGADSVIPFKSGVNSFTRTGIYQECVNKDGSFTVNESGWYIIWLKTTGANQYKINDVVYSLPECSGQYKKYYGMFDIKYLNVGDVCKSCFDLNALCIKLVNFD